MNKNRARIKKIVYRLFGEKIYGKAYVKGKIKDINDGVLDEKEAALLPYFIHEKSTVLDIGANYGHYAIDISRLCSKGHVHAFEPIPFTHTVLTAIITHFKAKNITPYHAAVSNKNGTISMTVPLLDFGAPNTGVAYIGEPENRNGKTEKVKTIKIDTLSLTGKVDFIKIDIEGHEPQAFEGMQKLILTDRPVVLIEFSYSCLNRAGENPIDFANYITTTLNLTFTTVENNRLRISRDDTPTDGYYFLIPNEKITDFQHLIES